MKSFVSTISIVCAVLTGAGSLFAFDFERRDQLTFGFLFGHSLQSEINNLNRMRGHVRWELGNYRANADLRREFGRISTDIDKINNDYRNNPGNHSGLQREIDRVRSELHDLEVRMKAKPRDYYAWS